MTNKPDTLNETVVKELEKIAKEELKIPTFTIRNRDSLDFHDCAVWRIKHALERAYKLGQESK